MKDLGALVDMYPYIRQATKVYIILHMLHATSSQGQSGTSEKESRQSEQ